MNSARQATPYTPEPAILELGDAFYDPVHAADFPQTILRFRNDRAAASVGLDGLSDAEWIAHFGRFAPLPGTCPSRWRCAITAISSACTIPRSATAAASCSRRCATADGRLMDLGTKGSGQTPWSRFGDGRLTLKGGVREILATEMLEALGVNTSRPSR
jgi:uncharacterized protein YdiU (UPF0061 family)